MRSMPSPRWNVFQAISGRLVVTLVVPFIARLAGGLPPDQAATTENVTMAPLAAHPDLEADADGDGWPDGWPHPRDNSEWLEENGNHFIRLISTTPDMTVMLYREISLPHDVGAIDFSWRQRVSNLRVGDKSWFDARIMLEFLDADRKKVPPTPPAPATRRDSDGWESKQVRFVVPDGARTLKFMPSLFHVRSGTFDLDDLVLRPVDRDSLGTVAPSSESHGPQAIQKRATQQEAIARRRDKAASLLEEQGSLVPGWNHEGRHAEKKNVTAEEGNHFLRLVSTKPGAMVVDYREIDMPAGVEALELRWRQRVTGLKTGDKPWFDARIMLEWKDQAGAKLKQKPSPPYAQKDTGGWVDRSTSFLVPEEAVTLVLMPSLFNVKAGTFDLDELVLRPVDPAPIRAAAETRQRQAAARHVPDEAPDRSRWPKMLKVVGNRLHDSTGKDVWLQGVNAGGLETLPQDEQPVKSLVVGIDEWRANCIRVPMNESFWWGKSPFQTDGGKAYRDRIDKMITLAANRGAYVVIDLHRYRAPRQEHADFWAEFAMLYKNHPAVLFDIFNEPHGISWEVWRDGGFVGTTREGDESAFLSAEEKRANAGFQSVGMQRLVDAIRSTGAGNIVIAGGLSWSNDLSGVVKGFALDDGDGNGIMYSWHTYNWHTGWAEKVLPTAAAFPIFLGEVGADDKKMDFIPEASQEKPATWVPDMLGFIQQHRINWTGWCFHPAATPRMLLDWDYAPTPFWGAPAKEALSGKAFPAPSRLR